MRVNRILVESYGEKSDEKLDFSQGNLRLIYGRNEAGKSTLLNFVRDALFGLRDEKNRTSLFGEAVVGGTIEFQLRDGRAGKVVRKWSRVGNKSEDEFFASIRNLRTDSDDVLDREAFQSLLGGANRDLFARYFGFTYQELASGGALLDKESLDRLVYGMILGGAERLEEVKKATSKRCEEFFLPRGQRKINEAIKRLQGAKKELRSAEFGTSEYKKTLEELDAANVKVGELKANCEDARDNLQRWQDLVGARELFEQFCASRAAYESFLIQTRFDEEKLASFDETWESDYARKKERRAALEDELPQLESETKAEKTKLDRLVQTLRVSFVDYGAQIGELNKGVELYVSRRDNLPNLERDLKIEQNALYDKLRTLGLLTLEPTDELFDETIKSRRVPVLETAFSEIDDLAQDEERLETKADDLKKKVSSALADVDRRTQEEKRSGRELAEKFGEETREEDVEKLEEIGDNFSGLKTDVATLTSKADELNERRQADAKTLRALVVKVCGWDVDDATFENVAKSLGAENVAEPLESEFNEIKIQDDAASKKVDDLQKDSSRLEQEIAKLKSDIQQVPQDVVSFETINERRNERRALWFEFKNDLFAGRICAPSTLDTLERLTLEVDGLADRRYERAELSGKLEEQNRTLRETSSQKKKVDDDLSRLQDERKALQGRMDALWRRVGLEPCVSLSIAAGQEWLDSWKERRKERALIVRDAASLKASQNAVIDELRRAFEIASSWIESNEETLELESLDKAVLVVDRTLKRAKKRLAEYREIVGKVVAQRNERDELNRNIIKLRGELAQTDADRVALTSRLDDFCRRRGYNYDSETEKPCARLKETLEKLRAWQAKFDQYDACYRKYLVERRQVEKFEARVDELKDKLHETLVFDRTEQYVSNWERLRKEAQGIYDELKFARKTYGTKSGDLTTKRDTKERLDEDMLAITRKADVSREDFAAFCKDAREYRRLKGLYEQESRMLREKLGVKTDEEFERRRRDLTELDSATVKKECERYAREVERLERDYKTSSVQCGELTANLKALEGGEPSARLSAYQEALNALREAINVYVPTLFARCALEDSLRICKEEKIPEILEYARELFQNVTSGRYVSIEEVEPTGKGGRGSKSDKDGLGFRVFERGGGTLKTAGQLSAGTREQLYLALRLAHVRQYCQQAEPLPIWADDVLLSASCERVEKLIEALKNFADEGYQVVLSTCQLSTRRAFEKIVGEDFVTTLRPRRIRQ